MPQEIDAAAAAAVPHTSRRALMLSMRLMIAGCQMLSCCYVSMSPFAAADIFFLMLMPPVGVAAAFRRHFLLPAALFFHSSPFAATLMFDYFCHAACHLFFDAADDFLI